MHDENVRWTMSGWLEVDVAHTHAALRSLIGSGCRSWIDGADFWKPGWGRFESYDRVSPSIP
jgi:hypothetical protein